MGRGHTSPSPAPAGLRRLLPAAALLLAGCVGGPGVENNDPLVGGPPLQRGKAAAPGATAARTPAPVDPHGLPPPYGPTSPAALAASPVPAGGLRIGPSADDGKPAGTLTAGPSDGGPPRSPGATLQQPEPIIDPTVRPTAGVGPPPPPGDSYRQLQDELARRGVVFQELQMGDDGQWRFRCGVPRRQDPLTTRVYEYRAPGDQGLACVRAVLAQIDRDRQSEGP
jgi:hypothetical protein